ncbi:MAG TPA: GNAT family N-acetyltransferase [Gaiellaceae bacterium]|nr:GNAT family N-acetyltransferase [Gaiellaceae bacterium]
MTAVQPSGSVRDSAEEPLELEPIADLSSVRAEWTKLAERTQNIFATWEWNALWWQHYGRPGSLLATACRSPDGDVRAILPFFLWRRRPLRVVRLIAHDTADQLGPICAPEDREQAGRASRALLARVGARVLVAERLSAEEGWPGLLGGRRLVHEPSPRVRFGDGGWEAFLRSRSRNFRSQVRSRERKLFTRYRAAFRLAADAERLPADLDSLFALHRARWASARTDFVRHESFHRQLAAVALERGWLRLWLLEVEGEPRAACYGFRFGDVECFYQSGRDPAWESSSVGSLVLLHAVREALSDGVAEYRLLRGGEAYKYRLATDDPGLESVGVTRGLDVSALLGLAAVGVRMRRRWRSAVTRALPSVLGGAFASAYELSSAVAITW